ncbi:MAG: PIG-L deacetylase family protein [Candidatus Hodarchaeota archaeon]
MKNISLGIFAHPDDAEFICTGTLALLHDKGWEIHVASVAAGDLGSVEHGREEIIKIRREESHKSCDILKGHYYCLECDDVFIMYDRPTLLKVITLVREVKPQLVFTHGPVDYMVDHENTSRLTQTACFSAGAPNLDMSPVPHFSPIPHLYYADPFEHKDIYGNDVAPSIVIDISGVIEKKERMLSCHESQRDWLLKHHGIDEYILSMKRQGKARGELIQREYAEGFRQHLGHAFPQDNLLKKELGDLCVELK